jgi:hypothetical protein
MPTTTALRRLTTLAAAAALLAGISAPASAGGFVHLQTIKHWKISAAEDLCMARGEYVDGTYLQFAIGTKPMVIVAIEDPRWDIPEGRYDVAAWVDRAEPRTFSAMAGERFVIWDVPLNEEQITVLSRAATLSVRIGKASYKYDLRGSAEVLNALGRCAGERLAAANPFAGTQSNTYQPDTYQPAVTNPFTGR